MLDYSRIHSIINSLYNKKPVSSSSHVFSDSELVKWKESQLSLDIPALVKHQVDNLEKIPVSGRHLFIQNSSLNSYSQWYQLKSTFKWISPVFIDGESSDISAKDFYHSLSLFEKHKAHRRDTKGIIFNTFKIMLPSDFHVDWNKLSNFALYMMENIGKHNGKILPYFFALSVVGKSRYLWIITSERFFYPKGKLEKYAYKYDVYKNSKNQMCKKDDPDAHLFAKAGTVYKQENIIFSTKTRLFSLSGAKALKGFMSKLKKLALSYFSVHSCNQDITLMLPRLDYSQYNRRSRKFQVLFTMNAFYLEMEKEAGDLLLGVETLGSDQDLALLKSRFVAARRNLADSCEGSYVEYGKSWKYKITALTKPDFLIALLEKISTRFETSLDSIRDSIFGTVAFSAVS